MYNAYRDGTIKRHMKNCAHMKNPPEELRPPKHSSAGKLYRFFLDMHGMAFSWLMCIQQFSKLSNVDVHRLSIKI